MKLEIVLKTNNNINRVHGTGRGDIMSKLLQQEVINNIIDIYQGKINKLKIKKYSILNKIERDNKSFNLEINYIESRILIKKYFMSEYIDSYFDKLDDYFKKTLKDRNTLDIYKLNDYFINDSEMRAFIEKNNYIGKQDNFKLKALNNLKKYDQQIGIVSLYLYGNKYKKIRNNIFIKNEVKMELQNNLNDIFNYLYSDLLLNDYHFYEDFLLNKNEIDLLFKMYDFSFLKSLNQRDIEISALRVLKNCYLEEAEIMNG